MKLIATRDFRNTHQLKVADTKHPSHIHKGAKFEIDENSQGGMDLITSLNSAGLIVDQTDEASVKALNAELAEDAKRESSDSKKAAAGKSAPKE